ncbi:MAG: ribonuclease J [Rhodospirillales bacterium]|jgi:ribonuclease J|nr:ribonuclease J [Rhodospirillales bacterium]
MTRSDELVFLPLGGAGEIGMNLNLYGFGRPGSYEWLMADLGITFGEGSMPGVDVILPDPAFIAERRDKLLGLVLTHAHEDHLGAVPYLWDRFECPIFATPFTAALLKRKLGEAGLVDKAKITVVPLGGRFRLGPFELELITLTHSIPEPNAVAIRTPLGTVLHTGDWKLDGDPVIGPTADEDALQSLGDEGVLAMVCDSTNVFEPGSSGSEADLLESLSAVIGESQNRVVVSCFSSNVARIKTITRAATANGRSVALAGRSLRRIDAAARETGYLSKLPPFLDESDYSGLAPDKAVLICTGSQGEPRAALARIAADSHPNVTLGEGDRVVFSSRVIPGNEVAIAALQNQLIRMGVEVITWKTHFVHVSGHPARDELARMYALARPRISVPVHGELRHLREHARLAGSCQVPTALVAENGALVRLAPGPAEIVERVPSGRLIADGDRLIAWDSPVVRGRTRALYHGSAVVTVVLNGGAVVEQTQLTTIGLLEDDDEEMMHVLREVIAGAVAESSSRAGCDDEKIREAVRIAVRRAFSDALGKRPVTSVHLVRN